MIRGIRNTALLAVWLLSGLVYITAHTTSEVELAIGGGWSMLGYSFRSPYEDFYATQAGSWSMTAHVGYSLLLSDYVGLGVGLGVGRIGGNAALSGTLRWNNVVDTDGEHYNHLTTVRGWHEQHMLWYLLPEASLRLRLPLSASLAMTAALGAQYGLPISASARYNGITTHTGEYPQWGMTLYDVDDHGFYTAESHAMLPPLKTQPTWDIFARAGVQMMLTRHTALTAQVFVTYALTDALIFSQNTMPIGFANDRPDMRDAHYFMSEYTSVLSGELLANPSTHPLAVGAELGLRWLFPHTSHRRYPCRCLDRY